MSVRILFLERTEPGPSPETKPTGIVAEAAVFSNGTTVLCWLTNPGATEVYASEKDMRKIREFSGRSRFCQPGPATGSGGGEGDPVAGPAVTPPDTAEQRAMRIGDGRTLPSDRKCPDGGACHHGCTAGCFRVAWAGPLSGVFPGDTWPAEIAAEYGTQDGVL